MGKALGSAYVLWDYSERRKRTVEILALVRNQRTEFISWLPLVAV